jgi:hypothetical protein
LFALRAPDYLPSCRLHKLVFRIKPSRISLWYLLVHLGVFNRQKVGGLRSHCSSTLYKAYITTYDHPPDMAGYLITPVLVFWT